MVEVVTFSQGRRGVAAVEIVSKGQDVSIYWACECSGFA